MTELLASVGAVITFLVASMGSVLTAITNEPVLLFTVAMGVSVSIIYTVKSFWHA